MIRSTAILIAIFALSPGYAQQKRIISANIDFHVNRTIYDRTISNNGTGFGGALQLLAPLKSRFTPTLEVAADGYGGTKELHTTALGDPIYAKSDVVTVLAGTLLDVSPKFYVGGMAGTAFFNSSTWLTIKPCIGWRLLNNRIVLKMAWANVFQHDNISNQNFGYLSFGGGIKLF
jgi:hypothetical protein